MQKEIYLIRHGETEYNKSGRLQGSGIDAGLNTTGQRQAQAFFRNYKQVKFDKVYASSLQRAMQTVEPFRHFGIPTEYHSNLNEINWGIFEGSTLGNSYNRFYSGILNQWAEGEFEKRISGGESPLDVAKRQESFLDLLFTRKNENRVLICMHGRAMKIMLCQLLKKPLSEMETFPHANLSLYRLSVSNNVTGVIKENCTEHLQEL